MQKSVEWYLSKGFEPRYAEYFAAGKPRRITSVTPNRDFTLTMGFDNGEVRILDCKPFLKPQTVFAPFMRFDNFKRVYLDDTNSVCWDIDPAIDSNIVWNNKVDISPDSCYLDSVPAPDAERNLQS